MPQSCFEQLRKCTVVVADTGDIESDGEISPAGRHHQPSLITAASADAAIPTIVDNVLKDARNELGEGRRRPGGGEPCVSAIGDRLRKKILAIVPGRVSTEVDARLFLRH